MNHFKKVLTKSNRVDTGVLITPPSEIKTNDEEEKKPKVKDIVRVKNFVRKIMKNRSIDRIAHSESQRKFDFLNRSLEQ